MKQGHRKSKSGFVAFLNEVKLFLLFYFYVVLIDYSLTKSEYTVWYALWLGVPFFVAFWVRQKAQKLWQYALGQVCVCVLCVFGAFENNRRVLFFLCGLGILILSWIQMAEEKKSYQQRNSSLAVLCLAIPGGLFAYAQGYSLVLQVFSWTGVAFVWFHIWNMQLANRQRYLLENGLTNGCVESRKMLTEANLGIGRILAVAAVFLGAGGQMFDGSIVERMLQAVYGVLRRILQAISKFTHSEWEEYVQDEVQGLPSNGLESGVAEVVKETKQENLLLEILGAIGWALLKIITVLAILAFVVLMVYTFWKVFYEKQVKVEGVGDEIEVIQTEKIRPEKKQRKVRFFGDNRQKIRWKFRKSILKGEASREQLASKGKTAKELVEIAGQEESLLPLYYKARYSDEVILKKDVKQYGEN